MQERKLENRFKKDVKKLGCLSLKMWCLSVSGLPDRLVLIPGGKLVWVELKRPGKQAEGLQPIQHTRLRQLGFLVFTISNDDELNDFLNYLKYAVQSV